MDDTSPSPGLTVWLNYLARIKIPVLRQTARALERLKEAEDSLSAHQLAECILQDPLMTLRVLAHIEATRRSSQNADITTIEHAVMMIGVTPFFSHFGNLPIVEEHLTGQAQALLGVLTVSSRARQAARFARDWAIFRNDLDVEEITIAALLHDTAEILMWCVAPTQMLTIQFRQRQTPGLRSADAQQEVIGTSLAALQLGLCKTWHLPELLVSLMDAELATHPRVRNVLLAVDLARHSAKNWDDPAIPDDLKNIGDLLGIDRERLLELLRRHADIPDRLNLP